MLAFNVCILNNKYILIIIIGFKISFNFTHLKNIYLRRTSSSEVEGKDLPPVLEMLLIQGNDLINLGNSCAVIYWVPGAHSCL